MINNDDIICNIPINEKVWFVQFIFVNLKFAEPMINDAIENIYFCFFIIYLFILEILKEEQVKFFLLILNLSFF